MRRLPLLILLGVAASAHAEGSASDFTVAGGLVIGRLAWDSSTEHAGVLLVAPAVSLEAFLGSGSPVALGLGLDATAMPYIRTELIDEQFEAGYELAATFAVVVRAPGHVWRAGAGLAISGFAGSGTGNPRDERMLGPVARGSLGWHLSPSVELALEVRAGYLFADHLSFAPLAILAALRFN